MQQTKCPWSQSGMLCVEDRCPLSNGRFKADLDKWALIGRTPRALSPEPSPGGGYDAEWGMLRKCRINSLFQDGQIVLDWMLGERMHKGICRELIEAERRYKDMVDEERCNNLSGKKLKDFSETDEEFQKWCRKAGIPPTKRQASKWLRKFGIAWRRKQEER